MTAETRIDRLAKVVAPVNYLVPSAKRPATYTFEPPPGVPWRTGELRPETVEIADGRPIAERFSLDRQGFALLSAPSIVTDFENDRTLRDIYFPEVERYVRQATGATRVIAFDHNLRSAPLAGAGRAKEPIKRAHNDFTELSGPRRAADELEAAGVDPAILKGTRFALINLWRPVRRAVEESPLAVCDARSMAPGDFVASDLIYRDRVGETYQVTHSPGHQWFYFPRLRPEEAILIKCFDSATDGTARFTAHAAFDDPTSPANPFPRESIEVRTLALYGAAG